MTELSDTALDQSVGRLMLSAPEMSAHRTLSPRQRSVLLASVAALLVTLVWSPISTLVAVNAVMTFLYCVVLVYSLIWFRALLRNPAMVTVSDEAARSIPTDALPRYTVLVAAYREAAIIGHTIRALEQLDYPRAQLEIKLLLEADDLETINAAKAANPDGCIEIVEVPAGQPRTKPKACNYGLQTATGEFLTIYDAEDRPEPLQLRRAVAAFRRLSPRVVCLQAKLHYHNVSQNFLTKLFAAEYLTWFSRMLPALVELRAPVPLGGTSMHMRREALQDVGAWDPFNVTEDADLGVRLHRLGFRTRILDSVTLEEANSDFVNWVKQRSRWYKGYLQTWLVHMRHPLHLWRQLGTAGFIGFNVVVGGTPLLALLNPIFWLLASLWFIAQLEIVQVLFPAWLFYAAMLCMVVGNTAVVYRTMVGVVAAGYPQLIWIAALSPIYWVMMSIAAIRAFAQLLVSPWHWEKTTHGLDLSPAAVLKRAQA